MGTQCGCRSGQAINSFLTAVSILYVQEQTRRACTVLSVATTAYSYCSLQYLDTVPSGGT